MESVCVDAWNWVAWAHTLLEHGQTVGWETQIIKQDFFVVKYKNRFREQAVSLSSLSLFSRVIDSFIFGNKVLIKWILWIFFVQDAQVRSCAKKLIISELKNLRPVGVSNTGCNIVEKKITEHFSFYVEQHDYIHKNQFGFKASFSIGNLISDVKKCFFRTKNKFFALI